MYYKDVGNNSNSVVSTKCGDVYIDVDMLTNLCF